MDRRNLLKGLLAAGTSFGISACGGGGTSSLLNTATAPDPVPSPTPTPTPVPTTAAPPPAPALKGVTIDQAEQDIAKAFTRSPSSYTVARTPTLDIRVSNADEFQAAVDRVFDLKANSAALSQDQRIVCAWNGSSMLTSGPSARVSIARASLAEGHLEAGGSLSIEAAPGYKPDFSNTVYIAGRGIRFQGIGFTRRAVAGENPVATSSVIIFRTQTFPVISDVAFVDCWFGARTIDTAMADRDWVNGLLTNGSVVESIHLEGCTFIGLQNAVLATAKNLRIDSCDFQAVLQDCVALRGHTFGTGYYANTWISKTTFRNSIDDLATRNAHADTIQTGSWNDQHLGYRLLVTDVISHRSHKFGGDGEPGAKQGIFNGDHKTADNQYVIRRSVFLCTSPHGFSYFSPRASRPSFVDKSVFTRAGTVPSKFAPDTTNEDYTVGITGSEPVNGPWLLVTDTVAKNLMTGGAIDPVNVDPRIAASIATSERPENLFNGRDFTRGSAAVNGMDNKFGYMLPNERGDRKDFVADIWANFSSKRSATAGFPDPRGVF